jgi:predicted nucleic acid-binding protein
MRLFLDTNIIIEYIERRSQYGSVRTILDAIHKGVHEGLVSQGSIYTLAYLTERALKASGVHRPELTERPAEPLRNIVNHQHQRL